MMILISGPRAPGHYPFTAYVEAGKMRLASCAIAEVDFKFGVVHRCAIDCNA